MLEEAIRTRQIPNEPFRRWFSDTSTDLIVWYNPDNAITGFQLCYAKGTDEHALTWFQDKGFSHDRVDDGEGRSARAKMTPILVQDGTFAKDVVLALFEERSKNIDPEIVGFVNAKITQYPNHEKEKG